MTEDRSKVPASLRETFTGGFRILIPTPIEQGSQIRLRLVDGEELSGTVQSCREVGPDEFHATVRFTEVANLDERRSESRIGVRHPAELSVIGAPERQHIQVLVTNISRSGLGLNMLEPLAAGTVVEVRMASYMVFGIVRHCHARAGAYRVGMIITDTLNVRGEAEKGPGLQVQIREIARQVMLERHALAPKLRCWFSARTGDRASNPALENSAADRCVVEGASASSVNCEVCQAVERWQAARKSRVLCSELPGGRGLHLHAVDAAAEPEAHVLELHFAELSSAEIRRTLQMLLASPGEAWITLADRSVRLR